MKILIIGLPGAGKTTLGRGLASKLDLPLVDEVRDGQFVDLDEGVFTHQGDALKNGLETVFNRIDSQGTGNSAKEFTHVLQVLRKEDRVIVVPVNRPAWDLI